MNCRCCETKENLSLHHVVPWCLAKFFPEDSFKYDYKTDLVILCTECHAQYELRADRIKRRLFQDYGLDLPSLDRKLAEECGAIQIRGVKGAAKTLLREVEENRPLKKSVKKQLLSRLQNYYQREEITQADLEEATKLKIPKPPHSPYKILAELIKDYDEFVSMWRNHFSDYLNKKRRAA